MRLAAAVLVLALAACGDDPAQVVTPDIDGGWSGTFEVERPAPDHPYEVRVQLDLLAHDDGTVTGCAAFSIDHGAWASVALDGTLAGATLEVSAPWSGWTFAGVWSEDAIAGESAVDTDPQAETTLAREAAPIC